MHILPSLYIDDTENKGLGVFTDKVIVAGTIIEESPVIVMRSEDRIHIDKTLLHDYIFEWEPVDKKLCCMALGYIPIYNHDSNANCEHTMDYKHNTIFIKAMRDIDTGEELTINYNGDWNNKQSVWFNTVD